MVGYGQVRQWNPGPLDGAEQRLKGLSEKLLGLSDEFAEMGTPAGWAGEAADAAGEKRTTVTDRMEQIVAGVAAARSGLMRAADAIIGLNHGVEEAENLAQANGFGIGEDGAVSDVAPPRDVPDDQVEDVRQQRERIKAELLDRVEQILRRANDIDNDLAGVLGKVTNGEIDTSGATDLAGAAALGERQGQLSVVEPPAKGGPGDNAGWWDSLSAAEKKYIIDKHPGWIGNRDGIPAVDRDKANRAILADEKARLEAEARRLQAELDDNIFGGTFSNADAALEQVRDKLKGIEAIEGKLNGSEHLPENERHYLLGFSSADDGRAIVAKGNPDTAGNVATFVPGTGADLPGVGSLMDRGDMMWAAADKSDGTESTSVITWLGYDAPDGLHNATSKDYAQDARHSLDSFQDGLRITHEGGAPSHNTVIGHSYGSTVIGHTGRDLDLDVDKMVFVGSPGVGVDNASQLNIDPGNVYATTAREDIIHEVPEFIHGNHPIDDDFGAHEFESDPGKGAWVWENVETHSAYWEDGNKSLRNMGHLIVGNTEKVR